MWNGINRRKFPRANYKCLITIRKRLTSKVLSTQTENIGAGGICVIIKEDLGLFSSLLVSANFPSLHDLCFAFTLQDFNFK